MKSLPEGINENEFIEILKEISWEVSDLLNSYEQGLDNPDDFKKNMTKPQTLFRLRNSGEVLRTVQNPVFSWVSQSLGNL